MWVSIETPLATVRINSKGTTYSPDVLQDLLHRATESVVTVARLIETTAGDYEDDTTG